MTLRCCFVLHCIDMPQLIQLLLVNIQVWPLTYDAAVNILAHEF